MKSSTFDNEECDGFTLIELLIVIVVLGILAAVVVFATGGASSEAQASACKVERRIVVTAAEAYQAEYGTLPTMAALVSAEWLDSASTNFDVDGTPLATGDC